MRRIILRPAEMFPRPMGLDHFALPNIPTLADLAQWLELDADRLAGSHRRHRLSRAQRSQRAALIALPLPVAAQAPRRPAPARDSQGRPEARAAHPRRPSAACPSHEAAHGFVPGRSVASHAAAHAGKEVVISSTCATSSRGSRLARACHVAHAGLPRRRGARPHRAVHAPHRCRCDRAPARRRRARLDGRQAPRRAAPAPEARPVRPRWPTSAHSGSTCGSKAWRGSSAPARAMPTTWCSPGRPRCARGSPPCAPGSTASRPTRLRAAPAQGALHALSTASSA